MGRASWNPILVIATTVLACFELHGQNTDCVTARIICSDDRITFTPTGRGRDDFANPNNEAGCLEGDLSGGTVEYQSAWYYFEFREDMPPNSIIEFTISPFFRPGVKSPDFDFAIFGPDLKCDSLGSPLRCSFSKGTYGFGPQTGLGNGTTDYWEPADSSDGFVAPMVVQPGEGYYLMLDNFLGDATGFNLTWGGSAAPFLNCLANPLCRNKNADAGEDQVLCQNPAPFTLNGTIKNITNRARYEWTGSAQALSFLNNRTILKPTVTVPADFTGTLYYVLTVTDGDCAVADAVSIRVAPNPPAQLQGDTIICQGETTTIRLNNTYQSYRWSNGETGATLSVNTGGTYAVTVSNGGACTSTDQITITLNNSPNPVIIGENKICTGESILLQTQNLHTTYFWSNGSRNQTTTISRGGNYSVTVSDAAGCRGSTSINVTESANPQPQIIGETDFCEGATAVVSVSQNFASYRWSNSLTTRDININNIGNFTVTVTDANGCEGSASISVTKNTAPTLTVAGNRSICLNSTATLTANTNATQIRWSTGDTIPTIQVTMPGDYTVTVTTASGCSLSETITITQQPVPQLFITDTITICPQTAAILTAQGDFVQFEWSNGASTRSIQVTQPGIYALKVTDAFGCTAEATQTVNEFPNIVTPTISGETNFCPEDGTTLTVNGNYTSVTWSNGDTTSSINVFATGTYTVTVSDANNCTATVSASVQAFEVNTPPADTLDFCVGGSVTISPGGNFVQYNWSNGSTTPSISVNTAAIYTLTVTDNNGCQTSTNYTIFENVPQQVIITGEPRFCKNQNTRLVASAGFSNYLWSNNATTREITAAAANIYSVTATDANNCNSQASITVAELPLPAPTLVAPDFLCEGTQATISINESFSQLNWSNGSSAATLNISQGGTYAVTVTDANGCQGSASKIIGDAPRPTVDIDAVPTLCTGNSATIRATAGFSQYAWSNGGTTDSIIISSADVYQVTVTDQNGCQASDLVTITPIDAPIANAGQNQALDCDTKSVKLGAVLAEQGAYRYIWEGPGINTENSNLQQPIVAQPGNYILIVIDTLNNCQSFPARVAISDATYTPSITLQLQDTLDCNTANVTISANGSHQGNSIAYQWLDNQRKAIANAQNLTLNTSQPGVYYFEIQDPLTGCRAIDSIEVMADFDPAFVEAGPIQELNCKNTTVNLTGSTSSTADYILYRWLAPNGGSISNSLNAEVDQPGWYTLIITNSKNGCANRDSVQVTLDRTPPVASAGADQSLNCIDTLVALQGTVESNGSGSAIVHSWRSDNGFTFADPSLLIQEINLPGLYTLEVRNEKNGCTAIDSVRVTDISDYPTDLSLQLTNPSCFGATDGRIQIREVRGGAGPYFFSLNNSMPEPKEAFEQLGAGKYQIRVEDVAGCGYETEVSLEQGILLKVDLGKDTTVNLGQRIVLEAFVNVPTQTITKLEWSGNFVEDCYDGCWLQPLIAGKNGDYRVTVTNQAGCTATDEIKVYVDSSKGIYIPNAFSPNGDGYNDVFMIFAGNEVTSIKSLKILSRWGNMVFEAKDFRPNDPTRGWNGLYPNGNPYNPSVFAYVVEVEYNDGTVIMKKGDLTLMK